MKKWPFFLAIIILATLQLIWPSFLIFFHSKPDLLLVFAIASVFYLDYRAALLFSLLAGLLKDVFLPPFFLINTFFFGVWSYLVYRLSRQISTDNNYVRLLIVLVVALINNIITGLAVLKSGNTIPLGVFLRTVIISSVYTTALSLLIFKFTKKLVRLI